MDNATQGTVLPFNKKTEYALFSPAIRQTMVEAIGTETASAEVDRIESALCNKLVGELRSFGERIGQSFADKIVSFFKGA